MIESNRQISAGNQGLVVAVIEFQNKVENQDFLNSGISIADQVTARLAGKGAVRFVERERLQDVMTEMRLGSLGVTDVASAARVGRLLGASHVITGSVARFDKRSLLTLRLVRVETGEIIGGFAEEFGTSDDLPSAVRAVADRMMGLLSPR